MVVLQVVDSSVVLHERQVRTVPDPIPHIPPVILEVELHLLIIAFVYAVAYQSVVITDHHLDHLDTLPIDPTQVGQLVDVEQLPDLLGIPMSTIHYGGLH